VGTASHPAGMADVGQFATSSTFAPNGATPQQVRQALSATGLNATGAGVTVGVISDSFNNLGGAAQDEASGALPPAADVHVLKDLGSGGTDEGRAMMQIVHDIAPGANLDFYTADVSEQDFANGILALASAGCKVICDDVTYFDEPFFQTGVVANAIQTVEQEGVTYLTAAGNQAAAAYQSAWNKIASTTFDGHTLTDTQDFGGNSPVQTVTIGANAFPSPTPVILQWNEPYGAATTNLALVVFSGGQYLGTFTRGGSSNPDVQVNLTTGFTYQIAIENLSGPDPTLIKDEIFNDSNPSDVSMSGANAGTVQGHHMSPYAITVGAVDSANTAAFGGTLQNENFSSSGAGAQLWFNYNGSAIPNGPLDLSPVVVSGVDDIRTTVPGLIDFFGTSAATPSVAGVVADMLQVNPDLTPSQIEQILEQTATPFGSSIVAGAGLANAAKAAQLADVTPPSLVHEGSISLVVGDTVPIPESQLQFDDNLSTHAQENYTVVTAPAHGALLKNGSATSTFTQADIDNGLIAYREDGQQRLVRLVRLQGDRSRRQQDNGPAVSVPDLRPA
jgi:hypothetical protein